MNLSKSPKEELKERLASLKKTYLKDVALAKLSCKFKEATLEEKAKMIKKGGDKDVSRRLEILYCNVKRDERKELFALLTKGMVIKGFVQRGMYLGFSDGRPGLSKEHYSIVLYHPTMKNITYRFDNMEVKMSNEDADAVARGCFPEVAKIEWR